MKLALGVCKVFPRILVEQRPTEEAQRHKERGTCFFLLVCCFCQYEPSRDPAPGSRPLLPRISLVSPERSQHQGAGGQRCLLRGLSSPPTTPVKQPQLLSFGPPTLRAQVASWCLLLCSLSSPVAFSDFQHLFPVTLQSPSVEIPRVLFP